MEDIKGMNPNQVALSRIKQDADNATTPEEKARADQRLVGMICQPTPKR